MRLVLDATGIRGDSGGMATYLLGLLRGWRDCGFRDELTIVGTDRLPAEAERAAAGFGHVVRFSRGGPLARIVTQQFVLSRQARAEAADAILGADPSVPLWRSSCPLVVTVHDLRHLERPQEFGFVRRTYRRLLWREGLRRSPLILTNSDSTAECVARWYPWAAGKTRRVYLGCDHVESWEGTPGGAAYAVAFGHWTNKQPEVSVRVWGALRRRREGFAVGLHLIGVPGQDRESLRSLARALDVEDLVAVQGYLTGSEFERLFASAALLLMPSTLEGFGLPVLEAMWLGVPVVASRIPSLVEVGGAYAFYASPDDEREFAEQCEVALFDSKARAARIEGAREHARAFTWSNTAEGTRAVIAEALRGTATS